MSNILDNFLSKKGQFCRLTFRRPLKTRASSKGVLAEKLCEMTVRAGVNYDNMASVQDKRENGELPAENAGLPWGEWFVFPYIIAHKGEYYLRFSRADTNHVTRNTYFIDSKEVTRDEVAPICLASEFQERDGSFDVFTVKASSIVSIV